MERSEPRVAIVLPPREGFSPDAVGAIGLLVHRLSRPQDLVLGRPCPTPFPDRRFVPVEPTGLPVLGSRLRYVAGLASVLRAARPELIEVHNRPEIALLLARRFPNIPLGLFLHNDPQAMRGARSAADRRALARRMRVVAVSEHLRQRFQHGSGDGSGRDLPVALLPNCLDLSALPPPLADAARDRLILFAGRLVADKGADSFVAACASALPALPGWRAEMIGADRPGPSPDTPFLAALRPAAARAGVVLAGYRLHGAVLEAMARAAIVVVPSRWPEPFGLTALEAMASGAALVSSGRGGLAELTAGAALRVDPDRPDALADALHRLANDPSERQRLAEAGRLRAREYDLPAARARLQAWREGGCKAGWKAGRGAAPWGPTA